MVDGIAIPQYVNRVFGELVAVVFGTWSAIDVGDVEACRCPVIVDVAAATVYATVPVATTCCVTGILVAAFTPPASQLSGLVPPPPDTHVVHIVEP